MDKNELRESVDGKRSTYQDFMAHVNTEENKGCGSQFILFLFAFLVAIKLVVS